MSTEPAELNETPRCDFVKSPVRTAQHVPRPLRQVVVLGIVEQRGRYLPKNICTFRPTMN